MNDLSQQADELEQLYPPAKTSLGEIADELEAMGKPKKAEPKSSSSRGADLIGGVEAAISGVTGAVAAPIGAVAGIAKNLTSGKFGTREGLKIAADRQREVQDSLTYQPRTEAGKEILGAVSDVVDKSKLAGMGPTEAISLGGAPRKPGAVPVPRAVEMQPRKFAGVGAAAAAQSDAVKATVANSSPELQSIVETHLKKGAQINSEVLARHVEADSLPVKVELTEGQATRDPGLISKEQNRRGMSPAFQKRFNEQNKQLVENTEAIRQSAAPDIYAQTKPEHGEILIDAYKAKDAKLNADISAKYQALRDANGGQFPLDSKAFVDAADAALHKDLLYDQVPSGLRSTLDRLRDSGSMTFENFESLRTNLARIQRSVSADGNVKHAAGIIRNALEDMPMPPGAENLKPLADTARAAAKQRFALIESDPAYKAVVTGKASADNFIDKHVIGADTKSVQTMKKNLEDTTAQQAVSSGVVNYLKQSARISSEGEGNFSQAGYNKALDNIRPKLDTIFSPEHKQQLETLGRVARYTQEQPRGSFVNNSNTLVGALAEGAKSSAEGAVNVAFKGVPVGTWTRKIGGKVMQHREDMKALQTGAGIRLKEIAK